jgi:hypothetical protein
MHTAVSNGRFQLILSYEADLDLRALRGSLLRRGSSGSDNDSGSCRRSSVLLRHSSSLGAPGGASSPLRPQGCLRVRSPAAFGTNDSPAGPKAGGGRQRRLRRRPLDDVDILPKITTCLTNVCSITVCLVERWEFETLRRSVAMLPPGHSAGALSKELAQELLDEIDRSREGLARFQHAVDELRRVLTVLDSTEGPANSSAADS